MGIKFDESKGGYTVTYGRRHPVTRQPYRLIRTGVKSKAEAERVYRQMIVQLGDKFRAIVIPKWSVHVQDFCKSLVERDYALKTVDNYLVCLKAHTFEAWGSKLIDRITTEEIRALMKERLGHRSAGHQKTLLKMIRGAFNFGVEKGLLQRNPTPQMKFRIGDKIKKVLTEEQIRYFLNKAKEIGSEWYPHWTMAIYTGMRNGELYALTWDKVNLDTRQILVDCSWNNKDGFKSTKTGDDRMLEIAPNLIPMLRELKMENYDSTFVLPRVRYWDEGYQATELRMFLLGIGLPAVRFHDLRATWATIMLSKGVEPIKVMKMGGWKDLKTMMIYARKAGVDIRGITNCLDLHNPSKESAQVLQFDKKPSG